MSGDSFTLCSLTCDIPAIRIFFVNNRLFLAKLTFLELDTDAHRRGPRRTGVAGAPPPRVVGGSQVVEREREASFRRIINFLVGKGGGSGIGLRGLEWRSWISGFRAEASGFRIQASEFWLRKGRWTP